MLTPTPLTDQLAAASDDRLRVLVVGAGVAGITLTQLLRRSGQHPVLLESQAAGRSGGYMLGLLPLVDPVMDRLGARGTYLAAGVGMHRYRLRGATGHQLREDDLDPVVGRFGDYRGISRAALLDVLADPDVPVSHQATVRQLGQDVDHVDVVLDEAGAELRSTFDVVIGADGLHSTVRELVLSGDQVRGHDTGWGGWVSWSSSDADTDLYEETWGDGFFLGSYPVLGATGMFVGGPRTATRHGPDEFTREVHHALGGTAGRSAHALDAVAADPDPYYWAFRDHRAPTWTVGHVALVGDAATGFLPTAGVGAAMAMEAAAVLAERLSGVAPHAVPDALCRYEAAERPRAESAQDASRSLARIMFRSGWPLTRVRDLATRAISLTTALKPILRLLADTPPPPAHDHGGAH